MIRFMIAGSVILLSACAGGQAVPPAGEQAAPAGDGQICRRITPTGSNMAKSECATAAEWAEFDRESREGVDEMTRRREQTNDSS